MARGIFRIVCALLLASSTVMLFSTPRRTSVTRVAQEIHHKVSFGTEELLSSATEWYEQADLPFAPGLAYLKGSSSSSSSPDSKSPPSSSSTSPNTPATPSKPLSESQKQKDSGLGHLSSLCRDTPWNPNITLHCHSSCGADQLSLCGGLAEARNRIQTCIRLAIDAGAGGALIIPPIVMKGADEDKSDGQASTTTTSNNNKKNGHAVCPSALFDFAGLQQTIGNWCPGLKIRTSASCRSDNDPTTPSGKLALAEAIKEEEEDPAQLVQQGKGKRVKTLNLSSRWRPPYCLTSPGWSATVGSLSAALSLSSSFRGAVARFLGDAGLAAEPVVLRFGDPYLGWDYMRSREMATLRLDLFAAVRHNASLGALGRAVGEQMDGDGGGRYIGVRLGGGVAETEAGGVEAQLKGFVEAIQGLGSYSPPARASPGNLKRRGVKGRRGGGEEATPSTVPNKDDGDSEIKTVYVSGGSRTAVQQFREMLQPLDYKVYDQWTLLEGNETLLAQIKGLDIDQRDVVEYEVLVRARYWMGLTTSPMSALLAFARSRKKKNGQEETKDRDADLDWFERYIYPSSGKSVALDGGSGQRSYEREMEARGDRFTKLLVVSGDDVMDYFP